ncbi:MAG: carbohydrate ABC transporter permease [Burkholderiales bacterium]|nr:carbohydrate ABC transporter permease [Burkholderiales bacterium]
MDAQRPPTTAEAWSRRANAVFLVAVAVFFLLPLWVMVCGSLKSLPEMRETSILLPPLHPVLAPWRTAYDALAPNLGNSLWITVPSTLLSTLLGAFTAYAMSFGRIRWFGTRLFQVLLLAAFIPIQLFLFPLALTLAYGGLFGTLAGVVVVHAVLGLPITTILFRNHFDQLPRELIRAAQIDGAGYYTIFSAIVLPLSLPMAAVVLLLQFTGIWNDFIVALVFAGSANVPMTVALNNMVGTTFGERAYDVEMAGALLSAALPLLLYFFSGRMFVRGILSGAVKG